ncbi:transposase InsO family protein [Novosphingobium chloroacetimidivorans]|uniref:Transposase InsO family protein n=1 Tax=Novosphingobium chloroacetimidivorans TaxID=1428314 RepID=A0A7W7KEM2_9SPHN|nr:transposase InsO family protein [Novosphingobium chloroacetimidivorans]
MKAIAQTLGVSRSAVQERMKGRSRPRGPYRKVDDAVVLPLITALVSARPTYGFRRIAALLNCQMRESGAEPVNHKRVYRIMKANHFLLARKYEIRPDYGHEGKVVTRRSNLRWCSDGFEFHCWIGEVVRGAFIIDAHDREIISWRAILNAGISGSEVRDMMLEAVEKRFGTCQAPAPIEMLTDNGSPYTVRETRIFARQIGRKPCFTPVKSPQSNGISEAFVQRTCWTYMRKASPFHRAIEHPGCCHCGEPQPGDERHSLPVAERRLVTAALTDWRPAMEPRHLGVHSGLVEGRPGSQDRGMAARLLHSLRLAATSGRSCSAARRACFERQSEPPGRIPDRAGAQFDTVLGQQPCLRLCQRDPRARADVRFERQFLRARQLARRMPPVRVDPRIASQPASDHNLVDVRDAHLKGRRRLPYRHATIRSPQHLIAQVLRVALS